MKLRLRIANWLFDDLIEYVVVRRPPDYVIGHDHPEGPYLNRWYLTPWRGWYRYIPKAERSRWQRFAIFVSHCLPSLYLHEFLRDDDDRAHHDHPAPSLSFMLANSYIEHTIAAGGIHKRELIEVGSLRFRRAKHAHRIELLSIEYPVGEARLLRGLGVDVDLRPKKRRCWTLFLFGPVIFGREWGFHCQEQGWIHWEKFTAEGKPGEVGKGCEA